MQKNTSIDSLSPRSISTNSMNIPKNGALLVPMTNDYLFRALLQQNNLVLKGLICALLHMEEADISSVIITNPIRLGDSIDNKTFVLDINVIMNQHHIINLEMQVINLNNWQDRSLSYLARNFDHLKKGEDYQLTHPVIQIGLLNYTLFPKYPEFYSTYQFLNVKKHTLYSDKLRISVLDLSRIDLATEEDRQYQLDYWAALFKAKTWEELQMLAQNNNYFKEASETVYQLTQEEQIRQQCLAREDYNRTMKGIENTFAAQKHEIATLKKDLDDANQQISAQNKQLSEKDAMIASLQAQLAEKNAKVGAE
ncbi:MAG: Rpn family recombination-promoting nuclease/putative transposase [Lachnospiraceae bacterium]|jgi:predicted transposase/invertase (TIGR01784 family)|nr:Rpn family recombination-promoting nuclease/putative transposase [Lachnospiraceae bacterium]